MYDIGLGWSYLLAVEGALELGKVGGWVSGAQEYRLELVHAGIDEEQRLVLKWNDR